MSHGPISSSWKHTCRVLPLLSAAALTACGGGAPAAPDSEPVETASEALQARAPNPVMLQAFYEYVPRDTSGSWWNNLQRRAAEWADAGITAVWLPPPYKGSRCEDGRSADVGYGVYDRYDLGEFDQPCGFPTRYGTRGELHAAIDALHAHGIQVYGDMVMNHLTGADGTESTRTFEGWTFQAHTRFAYPRRGGAYSGYVWHNSDFSAVEQQGGWQRWQPWDFEPYAGGDAFDQLLGAEIRYKKAEVRQETLRWSRWLTQTLGLDGYRLDAVKHIWTDFINQWLNEVPQGRFTVSEAWFGDLDNLKSYARATHHRTALFDVPLHYLFSEMSQANGGFDMRRLAHAGFTEGNGALSVSFVENHDTDHGAGLASPVSNLKELAYAYILTRRDGYPCIFYKDHYDYGLAGRIKKLLEIRRENAYGGSWEYTDINDPDVYVYRRDGDGRHRGLLLLLNDGGWGAERSVPTPFENATLHDRTGNTPGVVRTDANGQGVFRVGPRSYAVWVPQG